MHCKRPLMTQSGHSSWLLHRKMFACETDIGGLNTPNVTSLTFECNLSAAGGSRPRSCFGCCQFRRRPGPRGNGRPGRKDGHCLGVPAVFRGPKKVSFSIKLEKRRGRRASEDCRPDESAPPASPHLLPYEECKGRVFENAFQVTKAKRAIL